MDLRYTRVYGNLWQVGENGVSRLRMLQHVDLRSTGFNRSVTGLSPLVKLVRLYLDHTNVNGDVYGMSPLVELGNMRLEDTKVVGLAGALAPLVGLALLNLTDTAVGCYRAFCTGRPFRANCVHGLPPVGSFCTDRYC